MLDGNLKLTGSTYGAAKVAVAEAQRRKQVLSPVRGLYVLVHPQYRQQGVVPASWYIDDLCRHLGRNYYICYLWASVAGMAASKRA